MPVPTPKFQGMLPSTVLCMTIGGDRCAAGCGQSRSTSCATAPPRPPSARRFGLATASGKPRRGIARRIGWSPNGKAMLSVDYLSGRLRFWQARSTAAFTVVEDHPGIVNTVAWSPNGRKVALGASHVNGAIVCEPHSPDGEAVMVPVGASNVSGVCWSPDGKWLGMSKYPDGHILEVASRQRKFGFGWRFVRNSGIAWSPDGEFIAHLDNSPSTGCVRLLDSSSGERVKTLQLAEVHQGRRLRRIAWSPDGRNLAAGVESGDSVSVWDVNSGELAHEMALDGDMNGYVTALAYSPDGRILVAGDDSTSLHWCDAASGKTLHRVKRLDGGYGVGALAWHPDSTKFASSNSALIRVWDTESRTILRLIKGNAGGVTDLSWSPDGKALASTGYDGSVRFWDPISGEPRGRYVVLRDSQVLALNPHGHWRTTPQVREIRQSGLMRGEETGSPVPLLLSRFLSFRHHWGARNLRGPGNAHPRGVRRQVQLEERSDAGEAGWRVGQVCNLTSHATSYQPVSRASCAGVAMQFGESRPAAIIGVET